MAAQAANSVLDIAEEMGLNPALDLDLLWVVQEYLNAQLPEGWIARTYPDRSIHYVNEALRVDVVENPIFPRFKLLAKLMLRWKELGEAPDEMTVLELLDPIDRVLDVKEMVEFMGIDPIKEPHLLWLPKMNVLEALPPGWQEQELVDERIIYLNIEGGYSTEEHPNDREYKMILDRERTKLKPYLSIQPQYYDFPITRYKVDRDREGNLLETAVIPNTGTYMAFYDIYGRHFWYDIVTDHVTMDVREVKYIPAVITLQRIWRGFRLRKELMDLDKTARKLAAFWKTARFRRAVTEASKVRLDAVLLLQKVFRNKQVQVAQSRYLFRRLGMVGSRPGKPIRRRIQGIMGTGYSFPNVRGRVIFLQRIMREWLEKKRKKDREKELMKDADYVTMMRGKANKMASFRRKKGSSGKMSTTDSMRSSFAPAAAS